MSKTLSECAIEALNLLAQRSQETDNIFSKHFPLTCPHLHRQFVAL